MKETATREFPRRVAIENTTACNARCTMCPREKLRRKIETMDLPTFKRLLDDAVAAGASKISLHNFGEPLLDKDLAAKIACAKDKGVRETYIVTNASLMTEEKAEELIEAGLDRVKISFYGVTPEEYETIHAGLSYETTLANIKALLAAKKRLGGKKPKITLRYIGGPIDFLKFCRQWLPYWPTCSVVPGTFHNYSSGRNFNPISKIRRPDRMKSCRYLKRSVVYILANGDVVPCCYDFNGVLNMGNALEENIADIWHGPRFQAFRLAHKNHEFHKYPICAACDKLNCIFI
ncbi:MAG: radical SAM/SPASM domain-containing protein [Planctomycetota bacterium]